MDSVFYLLMDKRLYFVGIMVLEWREREPEDMNKASLGCPLTLNYLRRRSLLKLFRTANMRSQVRLLESLVQLWDHEKDMFNI